MDKERRERSLNKLKQLDPHIPSDLEIPYSQENSEIRQLEDVVHRAIALYCLATYADSLLQGNCTRDESFEFAEKFIKRYNADKYFTPKEKEFIEIKAPTRDKIGKFCWKWESLYAILYCIGFIPDIGLPTQPCMVPLCSKVFAKNRTEDAFLKASKLKSKDEILDFGDLIFCCNHAENKKHFESGVLGGWRDVAHWIIIKDGKQIDWDEL